MKHVLVYGMTSNPGGIESYLMGWFRRVQDTDFHVDFLCDFPTIAYADEIAARGAKVHFIPAKGKHLFRHLAAIRKVLKEHPEYETVYANVLDAGVAISLMPVRRAGRRIVVHSHNGDTDKPRLHNRCKPMLARMNPGRVACSKLAAQHMFGEDGAKALIIPNVIDAEKFRFDPAAREEKRKELGLAEGAPAVIHVGRISAQKNPLRLVDIMAAIKEQRPDAKLFHVGDGELRDEFRAYIRDKEMEETVLPLGLRTDIPALLSASDVFLLPSLYEGLPISLLEAQAAGLPCVASDRITNEASVTGLVQSLSLDAPDQAWADAVTAAAEQPHTDTKEEIARAGYDLSSVGEKDGELAKLLFEK